MKNRILQLMKSKSMSQQEFSRATGISPASLSSIFNGRTAPTMKHAEAMHRYFPHLNMAWLLFGEGDMFSNTTPSANPDSSYEDGKIEDASEDTLQSSGMHYGDTSDSDMGLYAGAVQRGQQDYGYVDPLPQSVSKTDPQFSHNDTPSQVRFSNTSSQVRNSMNVRARGENYPPSSMMPMDGMVNMFDKNRRKIVEIRIFFDDGTFETFKGNE